jgi:metal-dependent amidase/aminoacylase/carboxypeptidase family protein
MAANRPFTLILSGRGSHAAKPHEGDDVLTAACKIAGDLVTLPARKLDVIHTPCIISISRFQYGSDSTTGGVLSPDVNIAGTIRSLLPTDSLTNSGISIHDLVERFVQNAAEAYGISAKLSFKKGPPPTVNNSRLYDQVFAQLQELWPTGKIGVGSPMMTSEDYAFYTTATSCLYFRLGIAQDSLGYAPLHTSQFTLHPDALQWGMRLLVDLTFLSSSSTN